MFNWLTLAHIRPFGLPPSALPRDLSLALGSGGASPLQVASGYAAFASGGFRTDPYLIERVLDSNDQQIFFADAPFACLDCEPVETVSESAGLSELLDIEPVITDEAPVDDSLLMTDSELIKEAPVDDSAPMADSGLTKEVPAYPDVETMFTHGLEWRPTPAEAPEFFTAVNLPERAITPENAYLIYDMMRDVIQRGTGRRARELGRADLAGKTGTSNDRRDAWFSGYNGDIVATAWVGFDQDRSLGAGEEGSRTALPLWKYFMADALNDTNDATIKRPTGIITARIVPETGLVAPAGYSGAIFELFREGQVPERQASNDSGGPIDIFNGNDSGDDEDIF